MSIDRINSYPSFFDDAYVPKGLDPQIIAERRSERIRYQIDDEDERYEYDLFEFIDNEIRKEFLLQCTRVSIDEYHDWFTEYLRFGGKITKISSNRYPTDRYYRPISTITSLPPLKSCNIVSLLDTEGLLPSNDYTLPPCIEVLPNYLTDGLFYTAEVILYPDVSHDLYQYVPITFNDSLNAQNSIRQSPLRNLLASESVVANYTSRLLVSSMEINTLASINRNAINYRTPKDSYEVYESYEILMEKVGCLGEKLQYSLAVALEELLVRLYKLREAIAELTEFTNRETRQKLQKEISYLSTLVIEINNISSQKRSNTQSVNI